MPPRSSKQKVSEGTLRRSDQAVLKYLDELTRRGDGETCTASIPEIAGACSISERQVQISTRRLIEAGLLERVGYDLSNADRAKRGTVYKVLSPSEEHESAKPQETEENDESEYDDRPLSRVAKTTLAYGRNFHFFQERLENNFVYLELEDAPYDVGYRRIMVAIPVDVWEVIRNLGELRLDLVDADDEELMGLVESKVDKRMVEYARVRSSDTEKAELLRFNDSMAFGAADEEREKQVTRGLEYFRTERERQRGIAARMAQHKVIDIDPESSASN
jgi:DNA-binding Lrp family transcriptional regulator